MSEEMEKTPVVRQENAPVVKESQLPTEKKAAEVPAIARAKEEAHVDSPEADVEIRIMITGMKKPRASSAGRQDALA